MFRRVSLRLMRGSGTKASPPRSGPFDPYKILGVAPTASPQEIKKAYHKLALRFHPDGGPEGNTQRFQAVHEAYDAVKDGQWTPPPPSQEGAGAGTGGGDSTAYPKGWDATRRMYVYEEPGSTQESYVENNPSLKRNMQIMMAVCFGFIVVRMWLYYIFPQQKKQLNQQQGPSIEGIMGDGGEGKQKFAEGSVLADNDWATYRGVGQGGAPVGQQQQHQQQQQEQQNDMGFRVVDPLARR